jgi:hypothetical protein
MKIVVSRYNEDIQWINAFRVHVVLYNKGTDFIDGAIAFQNVGREGHTYFHYICENYDNLDDYTVFLQGNPFDHSPDIFEQIHTMLAHGVKNVDFAYFHTHRVSFNLLHGCYYHPCLPIKEVYEKLFERPATDREILFGPGAQFVVSRERILKRPREFYQKIVDMLGYHYGPDEGYVIERMHPLIFGDE